MSATEHAEVAERRVVFSLSVTYDTSQERLKQLPALIPGIIEQ